MIIKKLSDMDLTEETKAVIEEIKKFYIANKKECHAYYEISKKTNNIYSEYIFDDEDHKDAFYKLLVKTSIVIITANEYEKNILHMRCGSEKIKHYQLNCFDNEICRIDINLYFIKIKDFDVLHLEARQTGSYTIGGSADLVRFVLDNPYLNPQCIISYGICFGNDYKKMSLGDTIIAEKIYPYFISTKISEIELTVTDNNVFKTDEKLRTRLKFLKEKHYFKDCRVRIGNLITGEAVISNALIKQIFIEAATNQPIHGGEMEGYGLFKECQSYRNRIPCLLVKSICDWGVAKNINEIDNLDNSDDFFNIKDELQAYASYKAYDILEKILDKESHLFKIPLYEHIVNKLKSMKKNSVNTVSKNIIIKKVKNHMGEDFYYSDKFIDLLINILEENQIIKTDNHVYKIM